MSHTLSIQVTLCHVSMRCAICSQAVTFIILLCTYQLDNACWPLLCAQNLASNFNIDLKKSIKVAALDGVIDVGAETDSNSSDSEHGMTPAVVHNNRADVLK